MMFKYFMLLLKKVDSRAPFTNSSQLGGRGAFLTMAPFTVDVSDEPRHTA